MQREPGGHRCASWAVGLRGRHAGTLSRGKCPSRLREKGLPTPPPLPPLPQMRCAWPKCTSPTRTATRGCWWCPPPRLGCVRKFRLRALRPACSACSALSALLHTTRMEAFPFPPCLLPCNPPPPADPLRQLDHRRAAGLHHREPDQGKGARGVLAQKWESSTLGGSLNAVHDASLFTLPNRRICRLATTRRCACTSSCPSPTPSCTSATSRGGVRWDESVG